MRAFSLPKTFASLCPLMAVGAGGRCRERGSRLSDVSYKGTDPIMRVLVTFITSPKPDFVSEAAFLSIILRVRVLI